MSEAEIARRAETSLTTGEFQVPAELDTEGRTRLDVLGLVREGSDWATAAAVYAWTEPDQGQRTDLGENSPKYTLSGFADLGVRGLSDRATVRKYRRAWERAVREGWAEESHPGESAQLPERDFKGARDEPDEQPHNTQSQTNEWYTPEEYIEAARELMGGIDLDPASNQRANEVVQADVFYNAAEDGLEQEWSGRVWLNPPWGSKGPAFVRRLVNEYREKRIEQAVLLVNAHSTETRWFAPLYDHVLCFTDHRIDYDSPQEKESTSTHGSVFAYLGPEWDRFHELFSQFGAVVARWTP